LEVLGNLSALKREIGLFGATAYAVGIMIGAGVYALIGVAVGYAGNSIWLSFVLAAVIASFTALSYAELVSAFPESGGEYVYMKESFGSRFWAFIVGWLVLLTGVISSAAVALGFGGYMQSYVALPAVIPAVLIIIVFSFVSFWGIRESVMINIALTATEVIGLILIIVFGVGYFGSVNYLVAPLGINGVIVATGLVFFCFYRV
jgi:APA family basic amino acid/polyamine antiporter